MQGRNLDYPQPMQGYMAKQYLAQVQEDARALETQLRDNDQIPAWTLAKLATGSDRIGMAARYLLHKLRRPPEYSGFAGYGAEESKSPSRTQTVVVALAGIAALYAVHRMLGGFSGPPARRKGTTFSTAPRKYHLPR